MHIFLTGAHEVGKTTAIRTIVRRISYEKEKNNNELKLSGFRTYLSEEFEPGKTYVYISGISKVSDYEESIPKIVALRDINKYTFEAYHHVFDEEGVSFLESPKDTDLIIIDELGFMESKAEKFKDKVLDLLDGNIPIIGAIKPDKNPFLDQVRNHKNVKLIELNKPNREEVMAQTFPLIYDQVLRKELWD